MPSFTPICWVCSYDMCHINISCVYAFNITSSLINIHVINHINDSKAEAERSQLFASHPEVRPTPGGMQEPGCSLWVWNGPAAHPCPSPTMWVCTLCPSPASCMVLPAPLVSSVPAATKRAGGATEPCAPQPWALVSWPAPLTAASEHLARGAGINAFKPVTVLHPGRFCVRAADRCWPRVSR